MPIDRREIDNGVRRVVSYRGIMFDWKWFKTAGLFIVLAIGLILHDPGSVLRAQEDVESRKNHAGFPAVYPPPEEPPEAPPFILRDMFYTAGQGLHFGTDFVRLRPEWQTSKQYAHQTCELCRPSTPRLHRRDERQGAK